MDKEIFTISRLSLETYCILKFTNFANKVSAKLYLQNRDFFHS